MVREAHGGSLSDSLADLVGRAAVGAIVGALLLLALGVAAELLRRRGRARRLLAVLDLTLPMGVRTAVVSLLALTATFIGPRPVGAADSVRGWLRQSTSTTSITTTTTRPTVATPDAASARDATRPTTVPTGPVVLIPPLTIENPDSPPTTTPATSPTTAPPVAPVPAVATDPAPVAPAAPPAVAAPATTHYVVQRGDCLWSIAARLLGPGADARSIDAGWRRIYTANLAAIGDDPNLIHIGLTLELPPLDLQP